MRHLTQIRETHLDRGYLLVVVLVFGAIFFLITSSFFSFLVTQSQLAKQRIDLQMAGDIAEAGLNYYKWFLAHYPNDVTNGTGLPGPYVHTYYDPEGGAIGEFSLDINSNAFCGDVSTIEVVSTGHVYDSPDIKRTIAARYSRPTVAEFSTILNSNVWAGPDRVIIGPYHSNGGIRMDGSNNSTVTSGQSTWNCTSSFGCSPSGNRDGVFTTTANANTGLFSFPAPPINFLGLTVDLSTMQTKAQNNGGLYFGPSGSFGYRVTFNSNGTITVRRVTNTLQYQAFSTEESWQNERNVISASSLVGTYAIPANCPLIFVKDKVWLEGAVSNKVTIAAANVESATINPSIILNGNITYTSTASSGLLAIAEENILIGLQVPTDLVLNGIFVAQNGRYGRNYYCHNTTNSQCSNARRLPLDLRPYSLRNSETINGTIVSNGRIGTQWVEAGVYLSGFQNRISTYDRNLVKDPPPLIPKTSDVYEISEWRDDR